MMTFEEFKNKLEKSIIHGWDDEKLTELFEDLQDEFATEAYSSGWEDGHSAAMHWMGGDYDD